MPKVLRWGLQVLAFVVFAGAVGFFSSAPEYRYIQADAGLILVSFSHAGQTVEPCRRHTQEELNELAPNMRAIMDCPRERVPLYIEVFVDDELRYQGGVAPSGLAKDSPSTVYQRLFVTFGTHEVMIRMRDNREGTGYDYSASRTMEIKPGDIKVIDFEPENGGFQFL